MYASPLGACSWNQIASSNSISPNAQTPVLGSFSRDAPGKGSWPWLGLVQRHTLIVKAISEGFPDIVALQEVDTSFMGPN